MIKVIYNAKANGAPLGAKDILAVARAVSKFEKKIKGEIEFNAVSEAEIKKLNSRLRGVNKSTDVLSLAWQEDKRVSSDLFGQIFLCFSYLKKQAGRFNRPIKEECLRMAAHGLLHLAGHDHKIGRQAKKMFKIQEKAVALVLKKQSK